MRRPLAAAAVAAAALAAASPAAAEIVPQRSIAGVELSMTRADVRGVLGEPREIERGSNEFGRYVIFKYRRLQVVFQGRTNVTGLRTNRRSERTASGVGFGSTREEVREGVSGVRCNRRECVKGRFLPGRRVTIFRLYRGKVAQTVVGFVID
jgi:hypothetical protein